MYRLVKSVEYDRECVQPEKKNVPAQAETTRIFKTHLQKANLSLPDFDKQAINFL